MLPYIQIQRYSRLRPRKAKGQQWVIARQTWAISKCRGTHLQYPIHTQPENRASFLKMKILSLNSMMCLATETGHVKSLNFLPTTFCSFSAGGSTPQISPHLFWFLQMVTSNLESFKTSLDNCGHDTIPNFFWMWSHLTWPGDITWDDLEFNLFNGAEKIMNKYVIPLFFFFTILQKIKRHFQTPPGGHGLKKIWSRYLWRDNAKDTYIPKKDSLCLTWH